MIHQRSNGATLYGLETLDFSFLCFIQKCFDSTLTHLVCGNLRLALIIYHPSPPCLTFCLFKILFKLKNMVSRGV